MRTDASPHRELGLTDDELQSIVGRLGREPTYTELAMFSVMWSEHCSYKSSRAHLEDLPTDGAHVLVGPGEGAGVVEVAPGIAVAWKAESHNHPSFVEPFSGAATGVGGIVRDILSMGARPVALMDSLRFGSPDNPRTGYLVDGIVHGISSYGNSIGVPTVGGETIFEECYEENPLVNVACLGVIEGPVMTGRAEGPGNVVVLIGSSTGRDGIGGASVLASAGFDEGSLDKRPSVQVGDPFSEKLLIEACLELLRRGLVVGLQDLGAGGISCPTSEMSAKAGTGIKVDVDKVHRREPGMEPFEVMISESQERMMAVVEPTRVNEVVATCGRWGLDASVIGEVTATGRLEVIETGAVVADVPVAALAEEAPIYHRPYARPSWIDDLQARSPGDDAPEDLADAFLAVLSSPSVASKRWVWEQYDHMIFLNTIRGPGGPRAGDAAVIRVGEGEAGVAISLDGPGRYCYLDPYEGARLAVAEAARNVACVGARPVAVTNCLNFGNPEHEDVMWQFAEVVRGMKHACEFLGTPVTGGNVSFYNETNGRPIYPTPVIGMLGTLRSVARSLGLGFYAPGHAIVLLGVTDDADFGGSEYSKVVHGTVAGKPPAVDMDAERRLHRFLVDAAGSIASAHDLSHGGLAVALAECALAGGVGFEVELLGREPHRELFSETPGRAVVCCDPERTQEVLDLAAHFEIEARAIGSVAADGLDLGLVRIPSEDARAAYENAFESQLTSRVER